MEIVPDIINSNIIINMQHKHEHEQHNTHPKPAATFADVQSVVASVVDVVPVLSLLCVEPIMLYISDTQILCVKCKNKNRIIYTIHH